jgi:hypothetical protein
MAEIIFSFHRVPSSTADRNIGQDIEKWYGLKFLLGAVWFTFTILSSERE